MSNKVFGPARRLLQIAEEADLEPRFEVLQRSGILTDVMRCSNPAAVDRESLRLVLSGMIVDPKGFPLWRILLIGGISRYDMINHVEADGKNSVSMNTRSVIESKQFKTSRRRKVLRLARTKVGNLGFTKVPTTAELFARIRQIGSLCPAEVGPHLRRDYQDQPKGEVLWIAMNAIRVQDKFGYPDRFVVRRSDQGERLLESDIANPGPHWDLETEIIFVLRE